MPGIASLRVIRGFSASESKRNSLLIAQNHHYNEETQPGSSPYLTNGLPETETPDSALIAKIGARSISAMDIIERLIQQKSWQTIQDMLDSFVLEQAFESFKIEVTQKEVYEQITKFRNQHGLLTGPDTHRWLEDQHMDENDFLIMCSYDARLQKLKTVLFEKRIEEQFAYSQVDFVTVDLYKIALKKEEVAREIISSIQEGASFFDYARKYSTDAATAKSCGYLGNLKMRSLTVHLQDLVSKAPEGTIVGPVKERDSFNVYFVENKNTPTLTSEVREEIEIGLFKQWLQEFKSKQSLSLEI